MILIHLNKYLIIAWKLAVISFGIVTLPFSLCVQFPVDFFAGFALAAHVGSTSGNFLLAFEQEQV